jgi:urease accessory protein
MSAYAAVGAGLRVGKDGRLHSQITALRSQAPLMPHAAIAKEREPWAAHACDFVRVCMAAGAAGPVGGDHLRLDVHVGAGSSLVLTEASATLLFPGRDAARSHTDIRITVDAGATLIWLPEPVIAVRDCHHLNDVQVSMAADARLLIREEVLLGRHDEPGGRVQQQTQVTRAGSPLYSQDLQAGTATGATPVVAAANRAVGSILVVDPAQNDEPQESLDLSELSALMPLASGGTLISALAMDGFELRTRLSAGLQALGPPWDPQPRVGR